MGDYEIKHPVMRALVEMMPQFPEFLRKRREFLLSRPAFHKKVWEKALTDAGLIGPNPRVRFRRDWETNPPDSM